MKTKTVLATLNRIMELELAGVVRYTHYALMVYGYNRIPIVDWLQQERRRKPGARAPGRRTRHLAGRPSVARDRAAARVTQARHRRHPGESLEHEAESLKAYHALLKQVKDKDVRLEEYARDMIAAEVAHQDEVNKMLRRPGQTEAFAP